MMTVTMTVMVMTTVSVFYDTDDLKCVDVVYDDIASYVVSYLY